MRTKVVRLLLIVMMWTPCSVDAQNIRAADRERSFDLMVKQLDEFIARFNFEQSLDGSAIEDTAYVYWNGPHGEMKLHRKQAVQFLVDQTLHEKNRALVLDFAQQVCIDYPQLLDFFEDNWYAKLPTEITLGGKQERMTLTMGIHYDHEVNGSKWVIRGVDAPSLLSPRTENDRERIIRPSNNESDFVALFRAFEDGDHFKEYLPVGFKQDQLTLLYQAMVKKGELELIDVRSGRLSYHFLQVPGWVFVVEYVNRKAHNRGWLITELYKATEKDKRSYLKNELHLQ